MVSPDEYGYVHYEQWILEEFRVDPDPVYNHFPMYEEKKDHYNYLYLDPRVLRRMGGCSGEPEQEELFNFYEFVRSIFYVGKGRNDRAISHLQEVKKIIGKPDMQVSIRRRYKNGLHYLRANKLKYMIYVS